jgi:flagellar hook assembly protein FlgD
MVMIATTVLAESPASLTIVPATTGSVYNLYYKAPDAGRVKVTIYNNANQVVFTEAISHTSSFKRPYNFCELAEGEYTIIVEDKNGSKTEKVNYTLNKVTSHIRIVEVPGQSNKYILNVANNGTEEMYVRIYSSTNELLHEEKVSVTGSLGVVYNLSQIKASLTGNIAFEVTTSGGKTKTVIF